MAMPNIRLIKQLGFITYETLLLMKEDIEKDIRTAMRQQKTVSSSHFKKGSTEYRGDYLKAAKLICDELEELGFRASIYNKERIDVFWDMAND